MIRVNFHFKNTPLVFCEDPMTRVLSVDDRSLDVRGNRRRAARACGRQDDWGCPGRCIGRTTPPTVAVRHHASGSRNSGYVRGRRRLRKYLMTKLLVLLPALLPVAQASGAADLQPSPFSVTSFHHTAWSAKNGAPSGISAITQSADGLLWLGTIAGLYRFDGERFARYEGADRKQLLANDILTLYAAPSGELWVSYRFGGASLIHQGHLTNYSVEDGLPDGSVLGFARDTAGSLWANTSRGLYQFDGNRFKDRSELLEAAPRSPIVRAVCVDRNGAMWALGTGSLWERSLGAHRFIKVPITLNRDESDGLFTTSAGDAYLVDKYSRTFPLKAQVSEDQAWIPPDPVAAAFLSHFGVRGVLDRLYHVQPFIRNAASDSGIRAFASNLPSPETLTGGVEVEYEDREGDLWLGTNGGLDKFRPMVLTQFTLSGSQDFALAPGAGGGIWVGTFEGRAESLINLSLGAPRIPNGPPQWIQHVDRSPLSGIACAYTDPSGVVWLGSSRGVWRWSGSPRKPLFELSEITGHADLTEVQALFMDGNGSLWVSLVHEAVYRLTNGRWSVVELPYRGPAVAISGEVNRSVWLGYTRDRIAIVRPGNAPRALGAADGLTVGTVLAITPSGAGAWIGGDHGLSWFDGTRFQAKTLPDGRPFAAVSGIVETQRGDLWLNTSDGVVQVGSRDVQRLKTGAASVPVRMLDSLDGVPGTPPTIRPLPTLVQDNDGRLWFATGNGVAMLDPSALPPPVVTPNVIVESVLADGRVYGESGEARLPARTRNLEINYTSTSLAIPERTVFRYQLVGFDNGWREAGTRRQAFYTDLPPGHFTFNVEASGGNQVWNASASTLSVSVEPAFVQRKAFIVLCIVSAALALLILLRIRVEAIKRDLRARLQVRMNERERIARDLHDTLFQNIQGVLLAVDNSTNKLPEGRIRNELKDTLRVSDQVMAEGRERVMELRTEGTDRKLIGPAISQICHDMAKTYAPAFRVVERGSPESLHPLVFEEVLNVCREAIFNAFRHSGATQIEVEILFTSRELAIHIRDDGVGIDEQVLQQGGKSRHFGLKGMAERSEKIGAHVTIRSRPRAGTEVALSIPKSVVHRAMRSPWPWGRWIYSHGAGS